jgi:hypothetical protein
MEFLKDASPLISCILITTKTPKAAQPLVGGGLGWILPANLDYQHPKVGSDPEVGTSPAAKPLNQGVSPPPTTTYFALLFQYISIITYSPKGKFYARRSPIQIYLYFQ